MLVPVFFGLIGWGEHPATAWRYFIYNFAGGLTLLLATAAFGVIYGSTDVIGRSGVHLAGAWAPWIFAGFAFAFLVKTPVWPLHTWMPPTYSGIALADGRGRLGRAVEGRALRISSPSRWRSMPRIRAPVRGTVDGARGDLADLRRGHRARAERRQAHRRVFVALASRSDRHRDRVGQPAWRSQGALVYIVAHGLFSAALFLVLGYVEEREDTRSLLRLGGLGWQNPRLAGALCIAALAALGLPGLAGFVGELVILIGVYQAGYVWPAIVALVAIVLAVGVYDSALSGHHERSGGRRRAGASRPDVARRPRRRAAARRAR